MANCLDAALRDAVQTRWRGMRSLPRNLNQSEVAIRTLEAVIAKRTRRPEKVSKHPYGPGSHILVSDVTKADLKTCVQLWQGAGLKPSTIIGRLNCLSLLGVDIAGTRPRLPRPLKWWLSPEQELQIIGHLRSEAAAARRDLGGTVGNSDERLVANVKTATRVRYTMRGGRFVCVETGRVVLPSERRGVDVARSAVIRKETLADLIAWTTRTGLRIEESLRLQWSDIHERPTHTSITVSGTKTQAAQAVIPISAEAGDILVRRRGLDAARVFAAEYWEMQRVWAEARQCLGLADPKTATLKALRRSAARALHASKGMPIDLVRQILRHENVKTTMGYLRLTGGYGEDELARWL